MNGKQPLGLRLIAGAKIIKGILLALLAVGVFDLVDKDLTALAQQLVTLARISPENRYATLLLTKVGVIDPAMLRHVSEVSALYSLLLLTEGFGLWFGASWSEYLVVISSGVFVPEELLTTIHHFHWVKVVILVINASMVIYLVRLVWRRHAAKRSASHEVT